MKNFTSTINAPRFAIACKGFWHGKISKTAIFDENKQRIKSGYITEIIDAYNAFCKDKRSKLYEKNYSLEREAAAKIVELKEVDDKLGGIDYKLSESPTIAEQRKSDKDKSAAEVLMKRRGAIIKELSDMAVKLDENAAICGEEIDAMAERVKSHLAIYERGTRIKPIDEQMIPEVKAPSENEEICVLFTKVVNQKMQSILKEIFE